MKKVIILFCFANLLTQSLQAQSSGPTDEGFLNLPQAYYVWATFAMFTAAGMILIGRWINRPTEKTVIIPKGTIPETADMPPFYPNGWFRVANSNQLKAGDLKYAEVCGKSLVIFRGEDNQAYIVDAYCRHLGANIAEGGKVFGNTVACPFHGWRYQGADGKCTHIPYLVEGSKIPVSAKINSWNVLERNGYIFFWYDAEGREPSWYPTEVEGIAKNDLVYRGRSLYEFNAHIQEVNENGIDLAHFHSVHKFPFSIGEKLLGPYFEQAMQNLDWAAGTGDKAYQSIANISYKMKLNGKLGKKTYSVQVEQNGPGLGHIHWNSPFGYLIVMVTSVPIAPLRVQACFNIYTIKKMPKIVAKFLFWNFLSQFEQDVPIWNAKRFENRPLVVKGDGNIVGFRKWYSQFYSENSLRSKEISDM